MESDCDIIQQMCLSSVQNQMEITASVKDETMTDFMDIVSTSAVDDTTTTTVTANINHSSSSSSSDKKNTDANEVTTMTHRSHFVEIGEFSCGSIFGLGEHMDDRAIVAKHTQVQCLLIPHYWLFEKKQNAGNIWQR